MEPTASKYKQAAFDAAMKINFYLYKIEYKHQLSNCIGNKIWSETFEAIMRQKAKILDAGELLDILSEKHPKLEGVKKAFRLFESIWIPIKKKRMQIQKQKKQEACG